MATVYADTRIRSGTEMARRKADAESTDVSGAETKLTRVYADLVEKIGWIARLENTSSAQLLDPMIRPQIEARFKSLEPAIRILQRAESQRQKDAKAG